MYKTPVPDIDVLKHRIVSGCELIRNTPGARKHIWNADSEDASKQEEDILYNYYNQFPDFFG